MKGLFPKADLQRMAKHFHVNIKIYYKTTKTAAAEIILESETEFSNTANFLTADRSCPLINLTLNLDHTELRGALYNKQIKKLKKISFYDAISPKLNKSRDDFQKEYGDCIEFKNLRKFKKDFNLSFNFYAHHNHYYYTAELVFQSLKPDYTFILSNEEAKSEKFQIFEEMILITDSSYLKSYSCKNDFCGYSSRNIFDLRKHEKSCSDQTKFQYKEREFGNPRDIEQELIDLGVIEKDTQLYKVVTFDIETLLSQEKFQFGQTFVNGREIICSIGYYLSESENHVFVSTGSTKESGTKIVEEFLQKMIELQESHYANIPEKIKKYFELLCEKLKDKSLNVSEKEKLFGQRNFIREIFKLNLIGFNSSRFDLPVLFEYMLEFCEASKLTTIKKGNSFFSLEYKNICFRDASNYIPGASLAKFCKTFNVKEPKSIFPYEFYKNIDEMQTKNYPPNSAFFTSLSEVDKSNFISELKSLFNNFIEFADMISFFDLKGVDHYGDLWVFPKLNDSEKLKILDSLEISPKKYYDAKTEFQNKLESGVWSSFLDVLIFYNLSDCRILHKALENYDKTMLECFNVRLLSKVSLPALSESILWKNFSSEYGSVFSVGEKFGHINQKIRAGLLGGPTICFHRHCEIDGEGFHESVHNTPSGEPFKKFVSYDFNGLNMLKLVPLLNLAGPGSVRQRLRQFINLAKNTYEIFLKYDHYTFCMES